MSTAAPGPATAIDSAALGVFDLETTGVDVSADRIVTAHVGLLDADGRVLHARTWLADPGVEIPASAAAVHGITTERAKRDGAPAATVVRAIVDELAGIFARGLPVVAFNAPFDFSLLFAEANRYGIAPIAAPRPVIDPLVVDKGCDRFRKGKRTLGDVAAHYGVDLGDAHDATADAVAAGRIALELRTRFAAELPASADELHELQVGWARDQAASLSEYLIRVGRIAADAPLDGSWPLKR